MLWDGDGNPVPIEMHCDVPHVKNEHLGSVLAASSKNGGCGVPAIHEELDVADEEVLESGSDEDRLADEMPEKVAKRDPKLEAIGMNHFMCHRPFNPGVTSVGASALGEGCTVAASQPGIRTCPISDSSSRWTTSSLTVPSRSRPENIGMLSFVTTPILVTSGPTLLTPRTE